MKSLFRSALTGVGLIILVQVGWMAFLHKPVSQWLSAKEYRTTETPDYIVVLGGGGIPSESGLIRCYYGAELALEYTNAICIVSLPADEDPIENSVGRMKRELVMRGVAESRIQMEYDAVNTFQQARSIAGLLGESALTEKVALVSSSYHLRRAIMAFESVGWQNVSVIGADSTGAEADFGFGTFFRYQIWGLLESQATMARELVAIAWYKIRSMPS